MDQTPTPVPSSNQENDSSAEALPSREATAATKSTAKGAAKGVAKKGKTVAKSKTAKRPVAAVSSAPSLDSVLAQLNAQDEALKALAAQTKTMLANNAALKRSVRQVVKDASRHDELSAELNHYRKKWASLRSMVE